jgi:hypothetical protein
MRSLLVAGLFTFALLAGCSGNDRPAPDTAAPAAITPVVHHADGRVLPASAYPGQLPAFEERYVAERGGGEPTIGVDRDGVAIYPSIAFDQPGGLPSTRVMRSENGGLNWTDASAEVDAGGQASQRTAPASLDPYVYADPVTGRLFNIDLNLAAGAFLSWSDDGAKTWTSNPGCCGLPVDDHQTLFAGPEKTLKANPLLYPGRILYFCVNQVASSSCTHSVDGGLTWSAPVSAFPGAEASTEGQPLDHFCGGLHGHGHASETTGTVFLPKGQCGIPTVARSTDNGLTWQVIRLDDSFGIDGHEAIVSTDRAGNVYYFYLDQDTLPRLSISRDDGLTWSTPMNVTAPGVTVAKFPSIVAGDDGHVAFLYVGSSVPAGSHIWDADDDGNPVHRSQQENATWNVYVGMSLDALAAEPVFATVTAHPAADPADRGACAGRCQAVNGGMYDFLDIDINPTNGQVWVAFVDNCNGDHPLNSIPCNSPQGDFTSYRRSRAAVGLQVGGTLLGSALG